MKYILLSLLFSTTLVANSQLPDHIYKPNIRSVRLHKVANPYSYPIMNLHSLESLDFYFDDLDGDIKNYYYTFQLCNADWSPTDLRPFDYIRGFQTTRLSTYRNSSIAFVRYTNYYVRLPEKNCVPTKSGNYLLKVFLDNDTTKLVFTKRFLIVDTKASISGQVIQPYSGSIFRTHQKLQVGVSLIPQLNVFNQQDVKVVLLQNYAWPMASYLLRPTIYRGNYFEYSDEAANSFPAGKEWRWIDLRSIRLMSDRMLRLDKQPTRTDVYVKPDNERKQQLYYYYRDMNGFYSIETTDHVNPFWQSDYVYTHFTFFPPGNVQYPGRDVHLFGEFTNYATDENSKMEFNMEKGVYEKTLLLKQGFYDYSYVTVPVVQREGEQISFENTEGNYANTENVYLVLVYYRPFGGRYDELIAFTTLNSMLARP